MHSESCLILLATMYGMDGTMYGSDGMMYGRASTKYGSDKTQGRGCG